jgi:hypothetical protein
MLGNFEKPRTVVRKEFAAKIGRPEQSPAKRDQKSSKSSETAGQQAVAGARRFQPPPLESVRVFRTYTVII